MRKACLFALAVAVQACGGESPPRLAISATPWAAADRLFHQDAAWLGGDAAYSVELPDGRVLWLFGDSFVATSDAHVRSQAKMPHNTLGIQVGRDPAAASFQAFVRRETAGVPVSFFADDGAEYFWPGPAVQVSGHLLVTLTRVAPGGGLGFTSKGARAVMADETSGAPNTWRFRDVALPEVKFGAILSTGGWMVDGAYVYAYAAREPGNHDLFLARFAAADVARADLSKPVWWSKGSWVAHASLSGEADVVMSNGQTELSVTRDEKRGRYVEVQVDGFGGTNIVMRTAPRPEGPWSAMQIVLRPPESNREHVLVYAAKAHPELEGADLLVTYASNSTDFATLVGDTSLYYPRFVRVGF